MSVSARIPTKIPESNECDNGALSILSANYLYATPMNPTGLCGFQPTGGAFITMPISPKITKPIAIQHPEKVILSKGIVNESNDLQDDKQTYSSYLQSSTTSIKLLTNNFEDETEILQKNRLYAVNNSVVKCQSHSPKITKITGAVSYGSSGKYLITSIVVCVLLTLIMFEITFQIIFKIVVKKKI